MKNVKMIRDVTKFEFKFYNVWTSDVNRFKIQRMF